MAIDLFCLNLQVKKVKVEVKKVGAHVFYVNGHQKNVSADVFMVNFYLKKVRRHVFYLNRREGIQGSDKEPLTQITKPSLREESCKPLILDRIYRVDR